MNEESKLRPKVKVDHAENQFGILPPNPSCE